MSRSRPNPDPVRAPRPTLALCAALVLLAAGCGAARIELPHAVYAGDVPIYPGAQLRDMMGSTSMGDTPESVSDGMAWFFEVKAPAAKLLAFYEERLPGARRDPDWMDGVRLVWVPAGAEAGEELSVVIEDDALSIREEVRAGKRPGNPNADSQEMARGLSGALGSSDDTDD